MVSSIDRVPEDIRRAALERGTTVHAITERFDMNWSMGFPHGGDLDPTLVEAAGYGPYLKAWDAFVDHFKPEWVGIEERLLHNAYLVAGTADRIGFLNNGLDPDVLWVVDIKTGEPYPTYALQLAAYLKMWNEGRTKNFVTQRMGVYLQPNGKYQTKVYEPNTLNDDWAAFCACLRLTQWRRKV